MTDGFSFQETSTFIYFKCYSNKKSIYSIEKRERERKRENIRGLGLKYSQFETRERNET